MRRRPDGQAHLAVRRGGRRAGPARRGCGTACTSAWRDGHRYAVERREGKFVWKAKIGSPVVTAPTLLEGRLYVAAAEGQVCRLDPETGALVWTFDVAQQTKSKCRCSPRRWRGAATPGRGGTPALFRGQGGIDRQHGGAVLPAGLEVCLVRLPSPLYSGERGWG